jgi:trehalose 6-phosphate phosphatase
MGKTHLEQAPPILAPERCALFLDYDGTLVQLAPTPGEALADEDLRDLLGALQMRLEGALAIITGRPVADIDAFLDPLRLTVAGLHGLVRRSQDGTVTEAQLPPGLLAPVLEALRGFATGRPGTLVEDKRLSLALHYRQAPEAEAAAIRLAEQLAQASDGRLRLQRGKMVVELLPKGSDKGDAIRASLAEPEFARRTPVFVGDDVTDEAGFRSVNALGGITVRVGDGASEARYRLADVGALRRWLVQALNSR